MTEAAVNRIKADNKSIRSIFFFFLSYSYGARPSSEAIRKPKGVEEAAKQVGDEKIKGKNPKGATRCLQSKHLRGETHNLYY